jgi:hypothetical protein
MNGKCSRPMLFLLLMLAASTLWAQGPPFQTDDPVPVDLHHYEFYIFGAMDGTPAEIDPLGRPSSSTGAPFPGCNCTPSFPWGIFPSNNPITPPAERDRARSVHRHGIGRQDRHHQRIEVYSPDRHLYDV